MHKRMGVQSHMPMHLLIHLVVGLERTGKDKGLVKSFLCI